MLTPQDVYSQEFDPTIKPLPSFLDDIGKNDILSEEKDSDPEMDMTAPENEDSISTIDLSDVPDEFLTEASKFGETCRNHHEMPLYYDCRCMGVKFLDARIELGPDASHSEVQDQLGKACKDGTGIAGQIYKNCFNDFLNAPKELDPEEYCSCFGNTFAKLFEDWPSRLSRRAEIALRSKAQVMCQNPRAAKRLYGAGAVIR